MKHTRATPQDIFRIYRQLWGPHARPAEGRQKGNEMITTNLDWVVDQYGGPQSHADLNALKNRIAADEETLTAQAATIAALTEALKWLVHNTADWHKCNAVTCNKARSALAQAGTK